MLGLRRTRKSTHALVARKTDMLAARQYTAMPRQQCSEAPPDAAPLTLPFRLRHGQHATSVSFLLCEDGSPSPGESGDPEPDACRKVGQQVAHTARVVHVVVNGMDHGGGSRESPCRRVCRRLRRARQETWG